MIRGALWTSVALNLLGLLAFAPAALGDAAPLLPLPAPDLVLAVIFLWWARTEQLGTRANVPARVVTPAASVESTAVGRHTRTAADRRP